MNLVLVTLILFFQQGCSELISYKTFMLLKISILNKCYFELSKISKQRILKKCTNHNKKLNCLTKKVA